MLGILFLILLMLFSNSNCNKKGTQTCDQVLRLAELKRNLLLVSLEIGLVFPWEADFRSPCCP